jgi:hypothetical protein
MIVVARGDAMSSVSRYRLNDTLFVIMYQKRYEKTDDEKRELMKSYAEVKS